MWDLLIAAALSADPAPQNDWAKNEAKYLTNIQQLTFPAAFERAGEAYFSPDAKTIIFQAEESGTRNPFYQILTMDLAGKKANRVSPGIGKTTCAYYRPDGKKIIYASTHLDPDAKKKYEPEFKQREDDKAKGIRRRYTWDFDEHMDIFEANPDGTQLKRLTDAKGYDAEGSYSPDGQSIVFCSRRTGNLELFIMNADGSNPRQLTHSKNCYNGGPFFSPDGKRVIFRSDRNEKDRLQIYVINTDGTGERCITEKPAWVCWGPYWHPDNKHVIYAGADHGTGGRPNYDLYWLDVDSGKETRITFAPGADVLPVFSPDGKKMMWTSTRDGRQSSQIFIADFMPPTPPPAAPKELQGLIGEYGADQGKIIVLEDGGDLHIFLRAGSQHQLIQESPDFFRFRENTGEFSTDKVSFQRDRQGNGIALRFRNTDYPRHMIPGVNGPTFRINPERPVEALMKEALATEPPRFQGEFAEPDLVDLTTLDPTLKFDIRYATSDNFLGAPVYPIAKASLQRPAAAALLKVHRQLEKDGLGLLIHDGYRPWYVTKVFWDATPQANKIFVADPAVGSRHNRGCAVDLTLFDRATGRAVEMPGLYDETSDRSYPNYPGGTSLQRWYRDKLRRAMESEGFTVYEAEWWHFDFRDWKKYPVLNVPVAVEKK